MRKSLVVLLTVGAGILLHSCNNNSTGLEQPPPTEYAQPAVQPLKFSKPIKINWDTIKAVKVTPIVTKLNWDNLPETPYDTAGFKPFKNPVEETKFDYHSLRGKDLDIDKLPSHSLKFKTYTLPPPKLIKGAKLQLKKGNLYVMGFGDDKKVEGLPIYTVFTDRDGFLWISIPHRLCRYDGENLLSFLNSEPTVTFIYGIAQDSQGNIWISDANNGIEVLDLKGNTMRKSGAGQGLSSNHGAGLMIDKEQRIWAHTFSSRSEGVNIIDPKTQTVKWLDEPQGLSAAYITKILQDKNDNIWLSTFGGGVDIIDLKNKKIKFLGKTSGLTSDTIKQMISDNAGRFLMGSRGGLINVVDPQKKTIQIVREGRSSYMVPSGILLKDDKARLRIIRGHNEQEVDLEKRRVKYVERSSGLSSDSLVQVKQDTRGRLWIVTYKGLNMVTDNKAVIERIGKDTVNGLMEDHRGLVWDATFYHGIDILDRKTGKSKHLGVKQGLANDRTDVIREINNEIFITTDSGIDVIDTVNRSITFLGKKQGMGKYPGLSYVSDKAGRIWIGEFSGDGINLYDPKSKTLKHLGKAQGLPNSYIDCMCLDKQGRIWASTRFGGIELIDPVNNTVQYLINRGGLNDNFGKTLLPDDRGNIWIGTDKGINIADVKNQKLISLSASQGLVTEQTLSLLKYNGRIYAGTDQGITVIRPPDEGVSADKKWKVESHRLNKMFPGNNQADLITRDGQYWLGDVGISRLDLSKKDTLTSTPYITSISINEHPRYFLDSTGFNHHKPDTLWEQNEENYYLNGEIPLNKSNASQAGLKWDSLAGPGNMPARLEVPYNQNNIRFSYLNINLMPHDTTAYRYILIGADKKWSDITSETSTINYANLQPGKYIFEVTSRNMDNTWNHPAKLSFVIIPPWWRTWWAYGLYVFVLAGIILSFRSIQLIKEKRVLEHKVQVRTHEVMQQKEEIEAQRDNLEKAFQELKTTQNQLIQSEKMASLGELTAGIAHEIQNPLNFVNNFSDVNRELLGEMKEEIDKGDLEEIRAIANDLIQNEEKINHHGKRADAIVKGMLQHSKSSSGVKEPTNINALADEYMRLSYHGIRAKDKTFNAEMVTSFDEKLPKVNVIPQDMGRVFLNLFNNAFYAVHQKAKTAGADYQPTVEVTTFFLPLQGVGGLKVRDNGIGIPDSIKEKIMQPFFTTKPTGEGTGLGLSLTYDMVVKGHGGSIQVNSVEGEGSEFVVQLPLT